MSADTDKIQGLRALGYRVVETDRGSFAAAPANDLILIFRAEGMSVRLDPFGQEASWDEAVNRGWLIPIQQLELIEDGRRVRWTLPGDDVAVEAAGPKGLQAQEVTPA